MRDTDERENSTERAMVDAFVAQPSKRRMLELLATRNGRGKATQLLEHRIELDSRYSSLIPARDQTAESIAAALARLGAPAPCYVWSPIDELDRRELELVFALREVVPRASGAFISCIAGRLAYYQAEDVGERFI